MGILATIGNIIIFGLIGTGVSVAFLDYYNKNGLISTLCTGFSLQFFVLAFYQGIQLFSAFLRDIHNKIEPQMNYKEALIPSFIGIGLFIIGAFFSSLHQNKICKTGE